jgi:hypothetical protein
LYLVVRTDFVRPLGFDRGSAVELVASIAAFGVLGVLTAVFGPSLGVVAGGALVYALAIGIAWTVVRSRPVRVAGERELEQFVARVATLDDENKIVERLGALWSAAVPNLSLRALHDGKRVDGEVARWFIRHTEALAAADLATMKVGPIREKLEALAADRDAVLVPLVDRDELVGLVEAHYELALREGERGLLADSARAAARALTFAALTRAAARERDTAREVEVAEALRRHTNANRDADFERWTVAAEYRNVPPAGAGWSAVELADGRLAVLVTEAQTHGVASALATSAVAGAFAAATTDPAVTLAALVRALDMKLAVAVDVAIADRAANALEAARIGSPGSRVLELLDGAVRLELPEHASIDAIVVRVR